MTAGDVVNLLSAIPVASATNYQPAVGVEVVVLSGMGLDSQNRFGLFNGTLYAMWSSITSNAGWRDGFGKMTINNTNYLQMQNTDAANIQNGGFSGIQIK